MIELITGLPGNGKTLYTLSTIKERAERENRAVFYHGIPELTLNWERLDDPKQWAKCPPGSIIVLDEAQQTFRNRSMGATPPEFVQQLETHRHLGIDLVLITQHPSLIDPAVRRLAGAHRHMVRIWGMEASTVHQWSSVKDNCDKSRADSEKTKWAFDKKAYRFYKSSEQHTMKRSIPGRVKLLGLLLLVLIAVVWYVVSFVGKKAGGGQGQQPLPGTLAPGMQYVGNNGAVPAGGQARPIDPVQDIKDYAWRENPRVTGLPQTAPKYDGLTVPVRVPVPAACIQVGSLQSQQGLRCKCYSQQGTPMHVEMSMCLEFARNGFFQDFDAERDRAQVAQAERGQDVMRSVPDAARPDRQEVGRLASVTVIPNLGDPPVRPVRVSQDSILGK